jgi:Tol biopolymer transport system component/tRNA A-37 threonylcarbamoyl transferase component Bud32
MDAVAQLNSALTGRYEVEREIGAGGMATVYLARDLRHDRRVALKVLKPELGAVLGVERFLAEIKVTANLQHPNLLPLFDSGEANGLLFYVMPYVEGESLRARLEREKQLPVDEAVRIVAAIASALDYAHRHGVIHRDLKPENILLHEGQPLVADFGIALAVSRAGGNRITQTGLSLGTPQYMSPEQATADRAIDGRTDIYSLGAVLYEMLVGDPPYTGSTSQAIIAKVLTEKPRPVRSGRPAVPAHVEASVERALEKLPADRFATAHEFAEAVTGARAIGPGSGGPASRESRAQPASARARWLRRAMAIIPWVVALGAAGWAATRTTHDTGDLPTARFAVPILATARITAGQYLAVSPNGARFAWVGQTPSGTQIFVRSLDDLSFKAIAGTEAAGLLCFSPDGAWLAFFADKRLKKVSLAGGSPVTVASVDRINPAGCTWGVRDDIVIGDATAGLWRVAAAGGVPSVLTTLDHRLGERGHGAPRFLADGKTIAFVSWRNGTEDAHLAFTTLDGKVTVSPQLGLQAMQLETGPIVFVTSDGTLMAARFDPRHLVVGTPVPVAEKVYVRPDGYSPWGASPNGTLVMLRSQTSSRLVLVTRNGGAEPLGNELRAFRTPRVSPDGGRIAVEIDQGGLGGQADIWMITRASQTLSRLTVGGNSTDPLWTPDGRRIAFTSTGDSAKAPLNVYWQNSDGSGAREPLVSGPAVLWPMSWAPDGRTLVYEEYAPGNPTRIKAVRPGEKESRLLVPSPSMVRLPSVSPDGHWIAYSSNETGRFEVYVSPFPAAEGKAQVSTNGGDEPVWARNGRELFYRDLTSMVAAAVQTKPAFSVTARRTLFDDPFLRSSSRNYDLMPDDQHFLMLKATDEAAQFVVVTNWLPELKARLPGAK